MPEPDSTRFILLGTSHAGNVGAAARAIKVMGFGDLVLVAPRFHDVHCQPEAIAMASGATDVLQRCRVVETLTEALAGITYTCATAMTPRDFGPPTHAPRELFGTLAASAHRVAFIFGGERHGMSNADVYRCHACLSIPTAPGYGSLNLAQAVQILAYEWRQALGGFAVEPRTLDPRRADLQAVERTLLLWQQAMTATGFFDEKAPRKLMARLRRLCNRAELTREEAQILSGVARSVTKYDRKP